MIIGIVDDRWEIGALAKLAGQIAAGGIVVWSGAFIGRGYRCPAART